MNRKAQRAALIKEAQDIIAKSGNSIDRPGLARLEAIETEVKSLTEQIERAEKGDALLAQLGALGSDGTKSHRVLSLKGAVRQLATSKFGEDNIGVKALIAGGDSVADLTFEPDPVTLGKPLEQVTDVLGFKTSTRDYSYLRQTSRDLKAAPVADGDLKPESALALERIEGRLKVLAHLSEPVNKFWLEDNEALMGWIGSELVYGIGLALAEQILHGDGTGENFAGFDHVAGVQQQDFDTNLLLTTRQAVNKLDLVGETPRGFILHPNDWLSVETQTLTNGGFMLAEVGAPIDRVTRRLWGVPVVVSTTVEPGEGWLVGNAAATLMAAGGGIGDGPRISAEWGIVGDDFARNQLRARVEGRFDLAVERPAAIVKIATTDGS